MANNNSCLIISGGLLLVGAAIFGYAKIKEGATVGDIVSGYGVEVNTQCASKTIDGSYSLSVIYEKSKNRLFKKQKMELCYEFDIEKSGCDITGTGSKLGYTVVDTLNNTRQKNLSKDKKGVTIKGSIKNDTLNLIVSFVTESADDNRIVSTFPFPQNKIKSSLDGWFTENKSSSSGTAKLTKKVNKMQ